MEKKKQRNETKIIIIIKGTFISQIANPIPSSSHVLNHCRIFKVVHSMQKNAKISAMWIGIKY